MRKIEARLDQAVRPVRPSNARLHLDAHQDLEQETLNVSEPRLQRGDGLYAMRPADTMQAPTAKTMMLARALMSGLTPKLLPWQ